MKGRVLSFNTNTAHVWGQLKAKWDKAGISVPSLDSQIAATAHRHGLTVVTRNTSDFDKTGVKVLNPLKDDRQVKTAACALERHDRKQEGLLKFEILQIKGKHSHPHAPQAPLLADPFVIRHSDFFICLTAKRPLYHRR
jgi:hypothetical protein